MGDFASFSVDTAKFNSFVRDAIKVTGDLRLAFIQIGQQKYRRMKGEVFNLVGPGQYPDLTDKYKIAKSKKLGSAYPIFRGFTGALEKSITKNTDKNSVFKVGKLSFTMGTKVKSKRGFSYPLALQNGTKKMVARPFFFIDDGDIRQWTRIISFELDDRYQNEGWTG